MYVHHGAGLGNDKTKSVKMSASLSAGPGHLSCVRYSGGSPYNRRPQLTYGFEDTLKNDIQLLSYYITKFRNEKAVKIKELPAAGTEYKTYMENNIFITSHSCCMSHLMEFGC